MKTRIIVAIFIVFIAAQTKAQLRVEPNTAFQRGEILTYKVYYDAVLTGQVNAGNVVFSIKNENKLINNRSTLHIEAIGKTKGAFNWFYKVVDHYDTYVDEETLAPWLFLRRIDEGGYIINQDVTFNQNKNVAYFVDNKKNKQATITTPPYVQDLLSAIYYCRTYDVTKLGNNDEFFVKFLLDDTVYSTKIVYVGKETISTSFGKVRCLKLKPQVLTGTVFKDPYPVTLWVTDDKNKIPILAESAIIVGKVKLELINYSGLMNTFSALIK